MAHAKLSAAQATSINLARSHAGDDDRKNVKREIFKAIKDQFGIPQDTRLKAETSNREAEDFLLIKNSKTGALFELDTNGRWVGASPVIVEVRPAKWFRVDAAKVNDALIEHVTLNDDVGNGVEPQPAGLTSLVGGLMTDGKDVWVKVPLDAF